MPFPFCSQAAFLFSGARPVHPRPVGLGAALDVHDLGEGAAGQATGRSETRAGVEPVNNGFAPSPAPARTAPWHPRPDSNGRLAVRNRACYPCTTRAWSVREESNLHAEATGLRPAERTTCSTHGWVPCRQVEPALRAPQARAFPRRQKAPVDQAGFEPAASGVWDRRSGLAELLTGTPGRIRTCILLIRDQTLYPLGYRGSVPGGGVEPPAFRLSSGCSPAELTGQGGDYETRTRDPRRDKPVL